jgi:(1->4)-alpha-D-glucan 1-alpha-D-glucosylmutase
LFLDGEYLPLEVEGIRAEHVTAYARVLADNVAIVVSGRFFWTLCDGMDRPPTGSIWEDTQVVLPAELAGRAARDIYTGLVAPVVGEAGRTLYKLADLFRYYPFALLSNLPWEAGQGGMDAGAAHV